MAVSYQNNEGNASNRGLVSVMGFDIGRIDSPELIQTTVKEIILSENILTPGLQTAVTLQSALYIPANKIFDKFKNKPVSFQLTKKVKNGPSFSLSVAQPVYRLDHRHFQPINTGQTQEFTIHACDQSLLNDAKSLVSKSWKCTQPSSVVDYVLTTCCGVQNLIKDTASPARDYIAENIHPFQVVAQQGNVALNGDSPDFVHFMTYGQGGNDSTPTHYFKSLKNLCSQAPDAGLSFHYSDGAGVSDRGYGDPSNVIALEFPCDFDMLSDLLNGLDENGNPRNTLTTLNPVTKNVSQLGNSSNGCGIGGFNHKTAMTNTGSSGRQQSCNIDVESHLLMRQARMALLERDKIAMRMVVPWNPGIHVGKTVNLTWKNRHTQEDIYGSGDYLVTGMMHTIRMGGFSTTTVDCVSRTAGGGQV